MGRSSGRLSIESGSIHSLDSARSSIASSVSSVSVSTQGSDRSGRSGSRRSSRSGSRSRGSRILKKDSLWANFQRPDNNFRSGLIDRHNKKHRKWSKTGKLHQRSGNEQIMYSEKANQPQPQYEYYRLPQQAQPWSGSSTPSQQMQQQGQMPMAQSQFQLNPAFNPNPWQLQMQMQQQYRMLQQSSMLQPLNEMQQLNHGLGNMTLHQRRGRALPKLELPSPTRRLPSARSEIEYPKSASPPHRRSRYSPIAPRGAIVNLNFMEALS